MNKNDLRYQKTDSIIKNTFEECVNEYGFDKTTVSMICEKALINRHTFYIHFESKYSLLDSIFDEFERNVYTGADDKNSEWFIDVMIKNRERFLFLSKCENERMTEFFEKTFIDDSHKLIYKDFEEKKKDILVQLNIKYIVGAALCFVKYWFENFDKISREEAIAEIVKLNQSEINALEERLKRE